MCKTAANMGDRSDKKTRIFHHRHLKLVIRYDEELNKLLSAVITIT